MNSTNRQRFGFGLTGLAVNTSFFLSLSRSESATVRFRLNRFVCKYFFLSLSLKNSILVPSVTRDAMAPSDALTAALPDAIATTAEKLPDLLHLPPPASSNSVSEASLRRRSLLFNREKTVHQLLGGGKSKLLSILFMLKASFASTVTSHCNFHLPCALDLGKSEGILHQMMPSD